MLAFSSDRGSGFNIFAVPAEGGDPVLLVGGEGEDHDPAWSPDGSMLALARVTDRGRRSSIFLVEADGSGLRQLTSGPHLDRQPSWSPDGTEIAFVRAVPAQGISRIHVVRLGGGRRRLREPPEAGAVGIHDEQVRRPSREGPRERDARAVRRPRGAGVVG
ncbi:MAG TPA: hypothetical protein VF097_08825, partial [Actinomycetota bacterium]